MSEPRPPCDGMKGLQIANVRRWQAHRNGLAPEGETSTRMWLRMNCPVEVHDGRGLAYLQDTARRRGIVFAALVEAVKAHPLGRIDHAFRSQRNQRLPTRWKGL